MLNNDIIADIDGVLEAEDHPGDLYMLELLEECKYELLRLQEIEFMYNGLTK